MYARLEDKTVVSRFILVNFLEDILNFIAKFKKYEAPFAADWEASIAFCENIVATQFYITQIKTTTNLLMVTAQSIRGDLDDLEMMAINAGADLKMDWEEMGFKEVRNSITRKNIEGMLQDMTVLNANIGDNETELTAQGMTPVMWAGLNTKVAQVKLLNEKQDKMMADKALAIEKNTVAFEKMWSTTMNVARAGKIIFKKTSPARAKEYVMINKLKRIRHDGTTEAENAQKLAEQLAAQIGEFELTVKDFGIAESWVEDAEVEIQGTDLKLPTDEEGKLLVDLKEGIYNVIIRKETYEDVVITAKIEAGKLCEMTVELKALEIMPPVPPIPPIV